jgi:hypothetical protein
LIKEIESAEKERRMTTEFQQPTDNGEDLVESFLISEDPSASPVRRSSDLGKNVVL